MGRFGNGRRGGRSGPGEPDEAQLALIEIALVGLLTTVVGALVPGDDGRVAATFGLLVTLGAAGGYVASLLRRR